jgi:hypothetical protein
MSLPWMKSLKYNPLQPLLKFNDPALGYFTRRDLLDEHPGPADQFLENPQVIKLQAKQLPDGSWSYPARKNAHPSENYHLLETFRKLGILIETYGLDRGQEAVARGAEYLLAHQSPEGDIRGIFGSQYGPHYTAGMLELLIKAGYGDDPRVHKIFKWYQITRQTDGAWAWPLRTTGMNYQNAIKMDYPVGSDFSKPFSHALTMFVLRAYAAHPEYRKSPLAWKAGELLKSRFFQPDRYSDRKAVDYWFKFQHPFWWGNLLTALDSLSLLGFVAEDPEISRGLEWFLVNQLETGLWPTGYRKGDQADANQAWVGLAVCRVLKRFSKT